MRCFFTQKIRKPETFATAPRTRPFPHKRKTAPGQMPGGGRLFFFILAGRAALRHAVSSAHTRM